MLFLSINTWEPSQRNAIQDRFRTQGAMVPKGVKLLNMWNDAGGGRVFNLYETDDTNAIIEWVMAWTDLMSIEVVPLVDTENVRKMLMAQKK